MKDPKARDQSKKRVWTRRTEGSYMYSFRLKDPMLTKVQNYCAENGMTPSEVMRAALSVYFDARVRHTCKRRIERYEAEQK